MHAAAERAEEVLRAYRTAFSGFSPEEMPILDGILLQPAGRPLPLRYKR